MKKLLAVLCCIGMLALSGCSFIWPKPESGGESDVLIRAEYLSDYADGWAYRHLDDRLRDCYGAVYTAVKDGFARDEKVSIEDSTGGTSREYTGLQVKLPHALLSREEAQLLYTAFTSDNPQFFFIGNTYSYKGYRLDGVDYYDVFCLVYTMEAQDRKAAAKQMDAAADAILKGLPAGGDEFEKELYLHDRLIKLVTYDEQCARADDPAAAYPNAFSAYGALVKGLAVCEGYSRSMQLLLHRAGMRATLVSGFDENGVAHMWNLVTVDGRNYHLDSTWNDTGDRPRHTYFNLTTEEITQTHRLDPANIGIDTCTATEANYFRRTGGYLDTYIRDDIALAIAGRLQKGDTIIELRFPKDKYANALSFVREGSSLMPRVNKFLKEAGLKMWDYTFETKMEYGLITILQKPA